MRCSWVNLNNELYIDYHDFEWGKKVFDDNKLFEILVLEIFQAGLSFECVLNKRENFRKAFDNFDINKIINYDEIKIDELLKNDGIIKNKLKINAVVNNAKVFKNIINEYNGFLNYILSFNKEVIYENDKISNELSFKIYNDLKKRGMKFIGDITIYSYLQAIGIIYSHEDSCFLYKCN